jgi:type III pantothenate kinase
MSVLLRPKMALVDALWLSLATGLAVRAAVAAVTSLTPDIRWPNDLLIGNRKCGGILVETAADAPQPGAQAMLRYAVVGVGINVNHENFPPELEALATSLRRNSGKPWPREQILIEFLRALDKEIALLKAELRGKSTQSGLLDRFAAASSWVRGKHVSVDEAGGYTGVTDGLDARGFLRVAGDDGVLHTVLSGGVRAVTDTGDAAMLLALDVGNTNTVLGLYRLANEAVAPAAGPEMVANWRITTPSSFQTSDEFGVLLRNLFELKALEIRTVTGIAISSVVPPLDSTLRQVCELYFHVKPMFVEPGIKTGIPVLTDNPAELGADRIVNCVAAFERFGGPCIVVDMGTATTFDALSKKGEFLGGAIAPGLGISADALFSRAARLPRVDIKKPAKVIGTGTVDNIQIGLYYGYIGLVDGILERMITELGPGTRTVATGGLAKLIAGGSKHIDAVDDMLTLTGLRLIYERNLDRHRKRSA